MVNLFLPFFALTSDFSVFVRPSLNNVVVQLCPYDSFINYSIATPLHFCRPWPACLPASCWKLFGSMGLLFFACGDQWHARRSGQLTRSLSPYHTLYLHHAMYLPAWGHGAWDGNCDVRPPPPRRENAHMSVEDGWEVQPGCREAMNEECLLSQRIFTVVALWIKYLSACLRI